MGWLWASQSAPKTPAPSQDRPSQAPTTTPPSSSNKPSEWDMDPELQKFIALFQSDTGTKPEEKVSEPKPAPAQTSAPTPAPKSSISSWLPSLHASSSPSQRNSREAEPAPYLDPIAESLLPTEMSCRQAFDLAYYCQGIGGQWNSVYRYGHLQSCSDKWDDFWFCMRTKGYSGTMKEDAIRGHYRKKEYSKYGDGKPSSEDVWQARQVKVAPGTAFQAQFDKPDVGDEDWQIEEINRRRAIRQGLGIESASAQS